ncbi:WG repeat-containing protein [Limibacter armeniacum]|uniref:WG repeat-containing protein n=1 Tax=Limibacter armeniacum TaxID=466084 RepID=UPI002FE6A073
MRKHVWLTAILTGLLNLAFAQGNETLIPFRHGQVWGAVDKDFNEVIPFNYDQVSFLTDQYYKVKIKGTEGVMDNKGRYVIEAKYDAVAPLNDTLFQVFLDGKVGAKLDTGTTILPIQYKTITSVKDTPYLIVEMEKKFGVMDVKGKERIKLYFDGVNHFRDQYFTVREGSRYMLVDDQMQSITKDYYDDIVALGETLLLIKRGEKWGCMDYSGKLVVPILFDRVMEAEKGYLQVQKGEQFGLYNLEGKQLLPVEFGKQIYLFESQKVWVSKGQNWLEYQLDNRQYQPVAYTVVVDSLRGYVRVMKDDNMVLVNKQMEEVTPTKYYEVKPYNSQLFMVQREKKWGLIDKKGVEILPLEYDNINDFLNGERKHKAAFEYDRIWDMPETDNNKQKKVTDNEGLNKVKKGEKWALINGEGKLLTPAVFDEIGITDQEGPVWIRQGELYGALAANGKQLIAPAYQGIEWNQEREVFKVIVNDKNGIVDKSGKTLVAPTYNQLLWCKDGKQLIVKKNNQWGCIALDDQTIIPFEYDRLMDLDKEYLVGIKTDKAVLLDRNGKVVIPAKYTHIELARDKQRKPIEGLFVVRDGYKAGLVNRNGKELIPAQYDQLNYERDGLIRVQQNKLGGYFDTTGTKYFAE